MCFESFYSGCRIEFCNLGSVFESFAQENAYLDHSMISPSINLCSCCLENMNSSQKSREKGCFEDFLLIFFFADEKTTRSHGVFNYIHRNCLADKGLV